MKVQITAELQDWWATEEELASMTDAEIIELLHEDLVSLLECAEFKVVR